MIAIIGGGITGLTLALELERHGVDYMVLEATDRVGGVIRSGEVDGRLLEWGPQRARLTPAFGNLVKKLRLEQEIILAPPDLDLLRFFARSRYIPDQLLLSRYHFSGYDHRLTNLPMLLQYRFDLSQLDPETSYLDLIIQSP